MDRRRGFIQRRFFCERKFPNARERVLEASSKTREPTRNEFECSKHQHSKYFRFYRLSVFARKRKQRAWISSNFTPSSDRTLHISRTKKTPPRKASPSDLRDERIARTFERSRNRSSNEGRCGERKHVARVYVLTRAPLLIYDDDDNDDDDGRLFGFGVWEQKIKKKKFGRLREKKRHKIVK